MPDFYDYDAECGITEDAAKKPKRKNKKRLVHRLIVVAAGAAIIAAAAAGFLVLKPFARQPDSTPTETKPTELTDPAGETDAPETEPSDPTEESLGTAPESTEPETASPTQAEFFSTGGDYTVSDEEDSDYFDDAVFIGDSVSYGFELYVTSQRSSGNECLGKAQFLTSSSLSYANLLWDVSDDSVHPTYNGKKMKLEDSLKLIAPKKIYILLGLNDIAVYGVDSSIEHAQTMLGNIHNACPDAAIIVLAATPELKSAEKRSSSLKNADIDAFNNKMKEKCPEWGYIWLDFASQFKLEDGSLNPDYCGDPDDMGIHFLGSAYKIWVNFFEEHKIYFISQ